MAKFIKMNMDELEKVLYGVVDCSDRISDVAVIINDIHVYSDYVDWCRYENGSIKIEFYKIIGAINDGGNDFYIDDDDNWQWVDYYDYTEKALVASVKFANDSSVGVKKLKTKLFINN